MWNNCFHVELNSSCMFEVSFSRIASLSHLKCSQWSTWRVCDLCSGCDRTGLTVEWQPQSVTRLRRQPACRQAAAGSEPIRWPSSLWAPDHMVPVNQHDPSPADLSGHSHYLSRDEKWQSSRKPGLHWQMCFSSLNRSKCWFVFHPNHPNGL